MANKTQFEVDLRQARSSPRNAKRGCLCFDSSTYSRKCCDGTLWAQGIGNITQTEQFTNVPWESITKQWQDINETWNT